MSGEVKGAILRELLLFKKGYDDLILFKDLLIEKIDSQKEEIKASHQEFKELQILYNQALAKIQNFELRREK